MKIIDISLKLDDSTISYPGNPELTISNHHSIPNDSSNLTSVSMGTHTGTHLDAPKHVNSEGIGIDEIPLSTFVGLCTVLDMTHVREGITIQDLSSYPISSGDRVFVKTKNSVIGFDFFRDDYIYLEGDAACWLAEREIALFGIDYLSVKKRGSKDTRAHHCLLDKNIPIVEGLDLSQVNPGNYQFIGFPLSFHGLDGSPIRAVLVQD